MRGAIACRSAFLAGSASKYSSSELACTLNMRPTLTAGAAWPVVACRVMAALRFGIVSESVRAGRAWLDFARQVEGSGIYVLLLRDHFSAGPFGQQLASRSARWPRS